MSVMKSDRHAHVIISNHGECGHLAVQQKHKYLEQRMMIRYPKGWFLTMAKNKANYSNLFSNQLQLLLPLGRRDIPLGPIYSSPAAGSMSPFPLNVKS